MLSINEIVDYIKYRHINYGIKITKNKDTLILEFIHLAISDRFSVTLSPYFTVIFSTSLVYEINHIFKQDFRDDHQHISFNIFNFTEAQKLEYTMAYFS